MIVLLVAMTLSTACKADDGATKEEPPATSEPAAAAPDEKPDEAPEEAPDEPTGGTFGNLVEGATSLTVTQRQADGDADYGGKARATTDTEWIAKFVAAVGADQPASDSIPRCPPTYTLAFANAEGELATFGGVCAGTETVVLVRDGAAYSATDAATARTMLQDLAKSEPVEQGESADAP
jgi:hypothetical protein